MLNEYKLYFDGACVPNPGGTASYGFILTVNDSEEIDRGYGIIGCGKEMNDAYAERYALLAGLSSFIRHLDVPESELQILGDSKFIIEQIKAGREHFRLRTILKCIRSMNVKIDAIWIPREHNTLCDSLSKKLRSMNEAILKIA